MNVKGTLFLSVRLVMKNLKRAGWIVLEMINTENIPIIVINPIDFNAGCEAKIKTPIPIIVVVAEIKIPALYESKFFCPVLYSFINASVIKML